MNLTGLELIGVGYFDIQNFYEFIRERPKLERFVYLNQFNDVKDIGVKMAKYCGDHMHSFHDFIKTANDGWNRDIIFREKYNFVIKSLNLSFLFSYYNRIFRFSHNLSK